MLGVAAGSGFLELDDSWSPLSNALSRHGVDASVVPWNDRSIDWGRFDLVLVMYAWGYVTPRQAFLDWADAAAKVTTVLNNPATLRWNTDKTYLADLSNAGLPVVPTAWVPPGGTWEAPATDYVVKPTVASGGLGAARYRSSPRTLADAHVRRLHEAGHTAMIQPYLQRIDRTGETAVIFLDGHFSHAIAKAALLDADAGETERLWEREVIRSTVPTAAHLRVAEAVLTTVSARFGRPLYARIDLVDDDDGRPVLLEAELVEPSLFLDTAQGSAERLAAACAAPG